jgi:AraC-like DNA-binding protein
VELKFFGTETAIDDELTANGKRPYQFTGDRAADAVDSLALCDFHDSVTNALGEARQLNSLLMLPSFQIDSVLRAPDRGAAYLLAASGLLDGKRSTISWWLKKEASRRFPQVRWEPSRMIVRQGRIYTSGAAFSGLELITTLLIDLGFSKEERQVRKLMVLPPSRQFQSPYEMLFSEAADPFEKKLNQLTKERIRDLDLQFLAQELSMSSRTLARKFLNELQTTPGKWIQEKRLEMGFTRVDTTQRLRDLLSGGLPGCGFI